MLGRMKPSDTPFARKQTIKELDLLTDRKREAFFLVLLRWLFFLKNMPAFPAGKDFRFLHDILLVYIDCGTQISLTTLIPSNQNVKNSRAKSGLFLFQQLKPRPKRRAQERRERQGA